MADSDTLPAETLPAAGAGALSAAFVTFHLSFVNFIVHYGAAAQLLSD